MMLVAAPLRHIVETKWCYRTYLVMNRLKEERMIEKAAS